MMLIVASVFSLGTDRVSHEDVLCIPASCSARSAKFEAWKKREVKSKELMLEL
jgi:hypothetical protein